jgi:uncharacterized membrane protein YjjB (DUF3815 family)
MMIMMIGRVMMNFMSCLLHLILLMIKSRRMWWAGHVACMGDWERCLQGSGWEAWREEATGETWA